MKLISKKPLQHNHLIDKKMATILMASYLKIYGNGKINLKQNKGVNKIMGMTEYLVIGFLALLGFIAYTNSRKVTRELKKLGVRK